MFNRLTGVFAWTKLRPQIIWRLLGALWALGTVICPLLAADVPVRIEAIDVGFRGLVESGRWNSISIQITGTPGTEITARVTAADVEGRPVRQSSSPVVLANSASVISMVYQHGPIHSPVRVELLQGQAVLTERTLHTGADGGGLRTATQLTDFVVCLGESLLGFEQAARMAETIRETRPDRVAPLQVQHFSSEQLDELPPDPRGWESVDVCVISSNCVISDALGGLLQAWVRQGGRLVFIGGETVTSASASGLASWLPVKLKGDTTLHDITALNREISGSATLRLREGSLRTVQWFVESGADLAPSQDGALVVRSGYGSGTVTAIVLDINDLPFVKVSDDRQTLLWESLPDLCRWISGLPQIPKLEEGSKRPQSDLNPTGVSDLQTQLVNTFDRFPEVVRPSYWVALGTALLFLVLVGPLDYLLVHRVLKRPHWTWVTLPIWIGLGGAVGLSTAAQTGGDQELTRQLDLVTWDADQAEVQLDSWLTIYSPEHHRYKVTSAVGWEHAGVQPNMQMRWSGRPEAGFRGLYRSTGINGGPPIELSAGGQALDALPIRHGSSCVLEAKAQWPQTAPLTVDLVDVGDGHLRGTFSHQFDGELVDWVLAYGSFAYLPTRNDSGVEAPLRAGQQIQADKVPSRILTDYLVRLRTRMIERKDGKNIDYSLTRQAYDPLGRDLFTLLQTVSFHQLSGGQSYTGLTNSTLQTEDLSRLVDAHRAVVFGRWRNSAYGDGEQAIESSGGAAEPLAVRYTLDGKSVVPRYRECFVRWILPVKQAGTVPVSP